jgi:thioesterase domain-containing protein
LERAVGQLWTEVLGVTVTDPDADFFELGASSLQAATLCSTFNDLFGTELDVRRLVAIPTLAEQARYVDSAGALVHGSGEFVVSVAGTPGDPPLYLVPGGFGDRVLFQFLYRRVARWLGRRYHVLAVLPDEFSADEGGMPALDTLAKRLVADIEQRCPRDSVSLVGSCGGAVLAFEAATRLSNRDTQLVLIDPIYPGGRVAHLLGRAQKFLRRHLSLPRSVGARVSYHISQLGHRGPREAIAYMLDKLALFPRFYVDATDREGAGIAEPAERRVVRRSRIHYASELMSYRCERRYAGCVGLLLSADKRFRRYAEKWRDVSAAAVFVDIPGDHRSHVRDHVDAVARTTAETIERLVRRNAGPDRNQPKSDG